MKANSCSQVTTSAGNTVVVIAPYYYLWTWHKTFDKDRSLVLGCSHAFVHVWLTSSTAKFNHLLLLLWLSYCRLSKLKLPIFSWFKPSWYNADSQYASLSRILYKQCYYLQVDRKKALIFSLIWLLLDAGMLSKTHFLSRSLTLALLLSPAHLLAPHRCALAALYVCSNNNTVSIIKPRMS